MARGTGARIVAQIVALGLPCCSLLTSTDGLSDGAREGADAGADGAGMADAAPTPIEGGSADADAAVGPPGCKADELFCADFDDGSVEKGWDGVAVGPGAMTTDGDAFVSPARSALVTLPTTVAYTQAIKLARSLNGTFTSLRCSFAMRHDLIGTTRLTFASIETRAENGDLVTLSAAADRDNGAFRVRHYVAATDFTVPKEVAAPIAFLPGSWHTVLFEIDRTSGRIVVDGKPIASIDHDSAAKPIRATLAVGGLEMDNKNDVPWKLRFDDVRCDSTP